MSERTAARTKERTTAGILCPIATPLDDRGAPLIDLLTAHCTWLLEEGCHGLVLFGTTGEANSFTVTERRAVLEGVLELGIPAERLLVGTGCAAIGDTVELSRHAIAAGCRRLLVLPPFYYKSVSDEGVIEAYARAIEQLADTRLRLYFYRIPQLSGVDIREPVIEALLARYPEQIAGLKDSSGDWPSMQSLCIEFGDSLDVLVGSERYLLAALQAGAAGSVTATANAYPRLLRSLFEVRNQTLQERVTGSREIFERQPLIAALKEFTAKRTGDPRWRNIRPPLRALDSAAATQLLESARDAGLL